MKFTLSSSNIDFANLSSDQIVNHFKSSTCLTTKAGLVRTLSKAPFFAHYCQEQNVFFPRSYDLSLSPDFCSFLDDNVNIQAQSILSRLLRTLEVDPPKQVNTGVINVLCKVVLNYHRKFSEDSCIDSKGSRGEQCFTLLDSLIVHNADDWMHRIVPESDLDMDSDFVVLLESVSRHKKQNDQDDKTREKEKKWNSMRKNILDSLSTLATLKDDIRHFIVDSLEESRTQMDHPQGTINGNGVSNNLWIIKPSGKSRGRGIEVFHSLPDILRHARPTMDGAKPSQFVVQKYIENPLTIAGRKFDIRQWVMVTGKNEICTFVVSGNISILKSFRFLLIDWNPVTIWFYNDCYIRFAVEEYDDPQHSEDSQSKVGDQWTNNRFRHLVNNSVGKKSSNFKDSFVDEATGSTINGCMWSLQSFREVSSSISPLHIRKCLLEAAHL